MISKRVLPALAAISTVAVAQSPTTCTVSTTTVNSQADATNLSSSCGALAGTLVIGPSASGTIDISGPTSVAALSVQNNGDLTTLKSSSLAAISSTFLLDNVTSLLTLQFDQLASTGSISWTSVPNLNTLNLETGITKASSVVIADTRLSTLDGISIKSLDTMNINNNPRLTTINLPLTSLETLLSVQANGASVALSMPNLVWIGNMTIANVTTFSAPSLQVVNGSMRFDSNYFTGFSLSNLTSTSSGDISFIGNSDMTNVSLPALTSIGGGLQIANNTAMTAINGFGALESVGGAIKLRGNFTAIEFPALKNVQGAFDASSTGDITSSCSTLKADANKKLGGNGVIQGNFNCSSNNALANSDTGTGTSGSSGSSGSGSGSSSNTNSTAAGLTLNHALFGLTALGFAQALW